MRIALIALLGVLLTTSVVRCCKDDTECKAPTPKCYLGEEGGEDEGEDEIKGTCVECYANSHCSDGKVCDTKSTMKCVSAEKNSSALIKASLILLVVIASMIVNL